MPRFPIPLPNHPIITVPIAIYQALKVVHAVVVVTAPYVPLVAGLAIAVHVTRRNLNRD